MSNNYKLPTYKQALLEMVSYRNIRARVNQVLEIHQLNSTQWIILGLVGDHPNQMRVTDIARIIQVEGTFITNLVAELVKMGYVKLEKHPNDKRAKILGLTPDIMSKMQVIEQELTKQLGTFDAGTSPEERQLYFKVLESFISYTTPLEPGIL